MRALRFAVALIAGALLASTAFAGSKPYEGPREIGPMDISCPVGPTQLCVPLDNSFTTVTFDGVGGNGPANPADPCQRNDDDVTLAIALPFSFNLYGTPQTSVFINNNGNISFGASFSTFTSTGFPVNGFPMVAPFWADVDTRGAASGVVHYRLDPHKLVVIWDHVGYYNSHVDKVNTFELIISDGLDPLLGIGNNVCFCYDDMQWTTGDASSGSGGFGGTPATVGINKGDGVAFVQIGRFGVAGGAYDGPGGATDGIDYLDNRSFCFDVGVSENIPPIPGGFPQGLVDTLCVGDTLRLATSFASPEIGQTTTTVVNLGGLGNATVSSTPGNPSTQLLTFLPDLPEVGAHVVTYTATDNGVPTRTTTVNLTLVVLPCVTPTKHETWGKIKVRYR